MRNDAGFWMIDAGCKKMKRQKNFTSIQYQATIISMKGKRFKKHDSFFKLFVYKDIE